MIMTFPLVWVEQSEKHQFAAHLLQSKHEACQVRSMDGFCSWVPKSAVTHQLPPRQRRRPRKFKNYGSPESTKSVKDAQEEEAAAAAVSNDQHLGNSSTETDEETASTNSSSLSSLSHSSHDDLPPTDSTVRDHEYLSEPSLQSTSISARQPPSLRSSSTFRMGGVLLTDQSATASAWNNTPSFSALRAIQSIAGAVGNRVKSLFSWKRHKLPPKALRNETTSNKILVGTKRSRNGTMAISSPFKKPRKSPASNFGTSPRVLSEHPDILIQEVIRRIAVESFDVVREGIEQRVSSGKSLQAFISLRSNVDHGAPNSVNAIFCFCCHRYVGRKTFLSGVDWNEDANDTLKLLLDNGVNPHVALKETGQTPLHAAAASGCKCALGALLNQVEYTVDHLSILDSNGETAFHTALSNANYECFELFVNKYSLEILLEKVLDKHGENVLATLIRNTDIPYDQNITASTSESQSFRLLKMLLARLEEENRAYPLIHENKAGETVMTVAAICGCFHELKAISKLEFECGRSISNRCKITNGELKSPLDLARETKQLVEQRVSSSVFGERRINGIGNCANNTYCLENWIESGVIPAIELLEEIQKQVYFKSLCLLSRYRRGYSKVRPDQVLTEQAQALQYKNAPAAAKKVYPPSIRCDIEDWKCINGSRSLLRAQILAMIRNPHTIQQVTPALIRDPKDPCIRSSTCTGTKHYGLFATEFISKHTVICEYAGLVRREDEGEYDPNPEYGVELTKCDQWAVKEGGNYANAFILDAANVFNEASLINDVRDSVLEDESEPEILRTENVMYVEVLVNKWPRIFIITLNDIEAGEELLIDYGASYWEKLSLSIMKGKLEKANSRNAELEAHIDTLREQLKIQEATWGGQ